MKRSILFTLALVISSTAYGIRHQLLPIDDELIKELEQRQRVSPRTNETSPSRYLLAPPTNDAKAPIQISNATPVVMLAHKIKSKTLKK